MTPTAPPVDARLGSRARAAAALAAVVLSVAIGVQAGLIDFPAEH